MSYTIAIFQCRAMVHGVARKYRASSSVSYSTDDDIALKRKEKTEKTEKTEKPEKKSRVSHHSVSRSNLQRDTGVQPAISDSAGCAGYPYPCILLLFILYSCLCPFFHSLFYLQYHIQQHIHI